MSGKYLSTIEAIFPEHKLRGSNAVMPSPLREEDESWPKDPKFGINVDTGAWNDYRGDGKGNFMSLLKLIGDLSCYEVVSKNMPEEVRFFPREVKLKLGLGYADEGADDMGESQLQEIELGLSDEAIVREVDVKFSVGSVKKAEKKLTTMQPKGRGKAKSDADKIKKIRDIFTEGKISRSEDAEAAVEKRLGLTPGTLERNGSFAKKQTKGPLAGLLQVWMPHINPADGKIYGCKRRLVLNEDQADRGFKHGSKLSKTHNEPGSKTGFVGWSDIKRHETAVILEGEKDHLLADALLSHKYDIIGNLGGASTGFDRRTLPQGHTIPAKFSRYKRIVVFADNDEAGLSHARKIFLEMRPFKSTEMAVVRLDQLLGQPYNGDDFFDCVHKYGKDVDWLIDAIDNAGDLPAPSHSDSDALLMEVARDTSFKALNYDKAMKLYSALVDDGAQPLIDQDDGEPRLWWREQMYDFSREGPGSIVSFICQWTGESTTGGTTRGVHAGLRTICLNKGKRMEISSWCKWDRPSLTLYLPLCNKAQELVRISPDRIDVVPNGHDDVLIVPSSDSKEVHWMTESEYDAGIAEEKYDAIFATFSTKAKWQEMMSATASIILLHSAIETRPHIRFKGPASSGKSAAGRAMHAMFYGTKEVITPMTTSASLYVLLQQTPLVVMDDLEKRTLDQREDLNTLFHNVSGQSRRAKMDVDTNKVKSQVLRSWILTSGTEDIGKNTLESRMVVVPFVMTDDRLASGFSESEFTDKIIEDRDILMNYIYRRVQLTLQGMKRFGLAHVVKQFGATDRHRLKDYYGMLSLSMGHAEKPHPRVIEWIESGARGQEESTTEGSALLSALKALHHVLGDDRSSRPHDQMQALVNGKRIKVNNQDRYTEYVIHNDDLLVALSLLNRQGITSYRTTNAQVLRKEMLDMHREVKDKDVMHNGLLFKAMSNPTRTYNNEAKAKERGWVIYVEHINTGVKEDQEMLDIHEDVVLGKDSQVIPF